jgi:hypothetical protein
VRILLATEFTASVPASAALISSAVPSARTFFAEKRLARFTFIISAALAPEMGKVEISTLLLSPPCWPVAKRAPIMARWLSFKWRRCRLWEMTKASGGQACDARCDTEQNIALAKWTLGRVLELQGDCAPLQ